MATGRKTALTHEFLDYQRADLHFVYSFLWKTTTPIKSDIFSKGLTEDNESKWATPAIHERIIDGIGDDHEEAPWIGAYHPNYVFERKCIEVNGSFSSVDEQSNNAWLVVPMRLGSKLPKKGERTQLIGAKGRNQCIVHPILVNWTMRLFDSGAATITVRVCLNDLRSFEDTSYRFSLIHWVLRLTPNLDVEPEAHNGVAIEDSEFPITDSFIYTPDLGTCRLFELMLFHRDVALRDAPGEIFEEGEYSPGRSYFYADERSLSYRKKSREEARPVVSSPPEAQEIFQQSDWKENQTPYIFITSVLPEKSLARLSGPSKILAQEVGSICAKLTLDNRKILTDFHYLSTQYLVRALNYDQHQEMILNHGHDDRLFFTFGKRGALAISAFPHDLPALFVIPSLLNLFELAKARSHSGILLGIRLAELASAIADMSSGVDPIDEVEYAHLRKLVVLNLQNPMQYLFDGGSVTELASLVDESFFISQTWRAVEHSFQMVDRLMAAWETAQLRRRYER